MSASVQYDLHLGDSFHPTSTQGREFILMRYASKPNISSSSSKETSCVRNAEGRHLVSWKNDESNQVTYEGNENTTQDLDCLLLYDEEKQTFVLERPRLLLSMRKARKTQTTGKKSAAPIQTESVGREPAETNTRSDVENTSEDDFEMDIFKGMEELLEEEDDEDDTKTGNSRAMEDVQPTEVLIKPLETVLDTMDVNPPSPAPRLETKSATNSPRINDRRRKPALASTPIRRPLTTTSLPSSPAKPIAQIATPVMKSIPSNQQKSAAASSSESSSGSSDSGSSSSGSDNDSSSDSGSDSDDDFANLAENISQTLDSTNSAPPSQPVRQSQTISMSSNPAQPGTNKPRSLRAFLDNDGEPMEEDDAITSSSSDSE
ncbi:hypothetical protein INT44_002133 [Umbelopsis vinacea]|uniref:Transcription elongation factor Eaf N-terminal domain-containing protein n=1 Tax=Umbelopsis vinacea TaxID=44442 RepID=A0A8H7Q3R1_9FUNG|nr:hypothetical protein INT44_002133 [Umbelopsis vinacea]